MLRHVVFFKLKNPTPEVLQETKNVLLGMKGKIPEILDIEVGIDVVRSERSYDVALITTFESLEAMNAYQVNPVHVEVGKYIAGVRESAFAVDFEV
ncbi:Dabb family protein [Gorillibacterium sp. sgz5001074]|uniref:Dabb family protein n=1 Tax=Gorillibacterium sp. sgz5001074 TaxID=3446695 RepID=UPI003F679EC5